MLFNCFYIENTQRLAIISKHNYSNIFRHFLTNMRRIIMKDKSKKNSYSYSQPTFIQPYFDNFIRELSKGGYSQFTTQGYYSSISHFATWIQNKKILLEKISNKDINNFAKHHCRCRINSRKRKVSKQYLQRIKRFLLYLFKCGVIVPKNPLS
jgi:hypothetical protein